MQQGDIQKYCNLMEEVKRRINVINSFGSGLSGALYKAATTESVYLQFRKILELIAFGSLVANSKLFTKTYADFATKWNAKKLLKDLQSINSDFYPRPIDEVPSKRPNTKTDITEKAKDFLTRDEFVTLYQKCGKILHAENPYGTPISYADYDKNMQGWGTKIGNLLNRHVIRLVNDKHLYVIHLKEADGKAHGYVFSPCSPPT
jgi:hypothetical protein